MSSTRSAEEKQRQVSVPMCWLRLDDSALLCGLSDMERLFHSRLGGGSLAVLTAPGSLLVSCSAGRLLDSLQLDGSPLLLSVAACVRHQLDQWQDAGLWSGLVCAGLLRRLLMSCENATRRRSLRDGLLQLGAACDVAFLAAGRQLQLLQVAPLLALASTQLGSKPALTLTAAERAHLSLQAVRAFLQAVPPADTAAADGHLGEVHVQLVAGGQVEDSQVMAGTLLLPVPDPPSQRHLYRQRRLTLLFSCPLGAPADLHAELCEKLTMSAALHQRPLQEHRWQRALLALPLDRVAVLASQRPIAPSIVASLSARGVLVLQRLGARGAALYSTLTNADPISAFCLMEDVGRQLQQDQPTQLNAEFGICLVGSVDTVCVRQISTRSFIQLHRDTARVTTLLLHYPQHEQLQQEMKRLMDTTLFALRCGISEMLVVPAGPCLVHTLLQHLTQHKLRSTVVFSSFIGLLRSMTGDNYDVIQGHCWTDMTSERLCRCGLVAMTTDGRRAAPPPLLDQPITERCLVEPAVVRQSATRAALQACHSLLRVDRFMVKRAAGS